MAIATFLAIYRLPTVVVDKPLFTAVAGPTPALDQGPGKMSIARIVAHEWQTDGYLKPGKIKRVRRLTTDEFMSDVMGGARNARSLG